MSDRMRRTLKWLWDHVDTIGIGCMWLVAAIDLVILHKLDDACVWAMFAIVCSVQNRHRAELDRLRIEAIVTHRMIAAIVAEQARLHLKIDRVEGAMLKQKGN